jgi:hypothetical protein
VRQRQVLLKELRTSGAYQIEVSDPAGQASERARAPQPISLIRRLLGDQAVREIRYNREWQGVVEADLKRIARVFPEAEIREFMPLYEPCHPGCFPRGTPVETPDGTRRIETIGPGDWITTVRTDGAMVTSSVQSVFKTENRHWKVVTDRGILFTTQTQPLCLSFDKMSPAGELQQGDSILCYSDGTIQSARVLEITETERAESVFNLVIGDLEVFIAGGYLARSKPPPEVVE